MHPMSILARAYRADGFSTPVAPPAKTPEAGAPGADGKDKEATK
jgi:hypothetical protein